MIKIGLLFELNINIEGVRLIENMQCPSSSNMKIYLPLAYPAEIRPYDQAVLTMGFPQKKAG